jgi:Spy/CpxP family protein refolding chaperone
MKKAMLVSLVVVVSLLVMSGGVFAYGDGFGPQGSSVGCPREDLTEEEQARFEQVIENFRAKMEAIRNRLQSARETGDDDAFNQAHTERREAMNEKREALSEIVPEFAERYQNSGKEMRNCGREKGSGGFNR